jgi:predicted flap endonuclease-1-like 5' DNA nuclease
MRTLLAIFVAICSAVWLYASIYIYNCDSNIDCAYKSIWWETEITIMIAWGFVLWFLFWNIISAYRKKKFIKRSKLDKIQSSYTKSKKYWVHNIVDKTNANQNKRILGIKESNKIDTENIINKVGNIDEKDWLFGVLFRENKNTKTAVDNSDIYNKTQWTDLLTNKSASDELIQQKEIEIDKEENNEKKSDFNWNYAPDVNDKEFKIIQDNGEKGFTIKENIRKKDESILKVHQKNISDDLTKIEWIGPKIQQLLNEKNLYTFADISKIDPYKISDILALAGTRFQMHNPKTWPKQAKMASRWDWTKLKKYQDILKGGKE